LRGAQTAPAVVPTLENLATRFKNQPRMNNTRKLLLPVLVLATHVMQAAAGDGPIQDNSFLVEEAYNQDPGVVQHINTWQRSRGGDLVYSFTQEWPAPNLTHQLSYSIPIQRLDGTTGIGDVALNYRYQWIGTAETPLAVAPRLTVLLPTGDEKKDFGSGGTGIQFALPVSQVLSPSWITHWNVGATYTPNAKGANRRSFGKTDYNLGASVIWLATDNFNVMLETVYVNAASVDETGRRHRDATFLVSPGIRWAYNFENGLQIVPGIAAPIGVGVSHGDRSVFLYLSFEHPFVASTPKSR
jgi:hypothetical protein